MADKILNSALDIDPRVGLERAPEGEVGKAADDGVLPICSFASGRERRVAQLPFRSPQPFRGCAMKVCGLLKLIPSTLASSQENRTPRMRLISGKPYQTLPMTSGPGLLNSELLGPSKGRAGQLGAPVGSEWGVFEARRIG